MGIQMLIGDPDAKWYTFNSGICAMMLWGFNLNHPPRRTKHVQNWLEFGPPAPIPRDLEVFAPRQTYQEELLIGHAWAHGAGAEMDGHG